MPPCLECFFASICDDCEEVSSDAKAFFGLVLSSGGHDQLEHDTTEVFSRLVEKLPQVMLSNEESLSLLHARKLLAVTYFFGPRLISDYLLLSHDGIKALAKVEEAYKHEKEIKEVIEQFIQSHSLHGLQDNSGAAEDETGENRLLPGVKKVWPFLVSCFRNKNLLHDDLFKKNYEALA